MKHIKQTTNYSCAAVCFSMITGINEQEAIKLCKTKKNGTPMEDVANALDKLGKLPHHVFINLPIEECWFLQNIRYPMIINGTYEIRLCQRGRPRKPQHAIVIKDGIVFDPSERRKYPLDAYFSLFDKLQIIDIIIVENY